MLGPVDYFFLALMLFISAGIGIYFRFAGGKQKTTDEFLLAGKNMSIVPVAFSIMATAFSAITLLGMTGEMYRFGTHLVFQNIGNICGILVSAYLFLPVFFNVQVTTAYEYLERRFGKRTRLITSFSFLAQMMMYMSVVLYAPALALSAVTSLSTWTSVISIGVVCTFYCTLGGMKAVLWADVFQALLMYLCLFAVVIQGCIDVGGIRNVFRIANEGGRLQVPGASVDPTVRYTMWNVFLQGFLISMAGTVGNQVQIQRLLTVKNINKSRSALFLSIPMFVGFSLMNCFAGIVIYAYFAGCDPVSSKGKPIASADQLLPYYVMKGLGHIPGLPGICICGIFSAALSTVSSAVNSLAAVTMEDWVRPLCAARKIKNWKVSLVAKATTLFYGALCVSLTFLVASFGDLVQATYTVYGLFAGPVFGVFFLGMMTTRSNEKGVIVGLVVSVILTAWLSFGASSFAPRPKVLPVSTANCPLHYNTSQHASMSPNFTYDGNFSAKVYSASLQEGKNSTTFPSTMSTPKANENRYVFPLYKVSYMWFAIIGFVVSVAVGYIASICANLISGNPADPEPEYLSPVLWRFLKSSSSRTQANGAKQDQNLQLSPG